MKKYILKIAICVPLFLALSCSEAQDKSPIELDKMATILADIHVAEYYSQGLGEDIPKFKKNQDSLALFYSSILAHHQMSLQQFDSTYDWFLDHPAIMDSLYLKVNEKLEGMRKAFKTKIGNADNLPEQVITQPLDSTINIQPIQSREE